MFCTIIILADCVVNSQDPWSRSTGRDSKELDEARISAVIEKKSLKSRELVLKKIARGGGSKLRDSENDDTDEDDSSLSNNSTTIESGRNPPREKKNVQQNLEIIYGCVSLADSPGRVVVRGPQVHKPMENIQYLSYYHVLKLVCIRHF
jgi:hypothetical protein